MPIIETKELSKYYGDVRGIHEINVCVEQGEFFGFIGPNGSGKSTAIRTLLGLIKPTTGTANVLGKNIQSQQTAILQQIGYMPSEAMFYNGMRVKEILKLSAKLHGKDCTAEAMALCDRLKLDVQKKVETLSLGNRKKVAIVCALQHRPALYILDEPTSGLDPLMQKEFFTILTERHKEGATIFLSSHVLTEIQHYCQRAAIIRNGEIIACDTTENLAKTTAKKISLKGISSMPEILNCSNVKAYDTHVDFLYSGPIKELLAAIESLPFTDLTIAEPSLDDMFLHYYEEGERVK